jgi:hypothetical protein
MATKTVVKKKKSSVKKSPKESSERVKTYRVLKDGIRHGLSVRNFGDFLPEAKTLPTLRTLLTTNTIEEVWVDREEFEEWEADQAERDEALAEELAAAEEDSEDVAESRPRKKVVKKTAVKKTIKKGKSSGRKLEQQPV